MSAHQLHRALARLNLRCFNVRPQRIQILRTPTAFYESLIERCDRATTRVTLRALYWVTGPLAVNLAEAVARAAGRGVAVNVTLDAARAGRRDQDGRTSVDALAAVEEAGGDIHLVDASGRSGLIGEILGVYHAKACVFDDAALLTAISAVVIAEKEAEAKAQQLQLSPPPLPKEELPAIYAAAEGQGFASEQAPKVSKAAGKERIGPIPNKQFWDDSDDEDPALSSSQRRQRRAR